MTHRPPNWATPAFLHAKRCAAADVLGQLSVQPESRGARAAFVVEPVVGQVDEGLFRPCIPDGFDADVATGRECDGRVAPGRERHAGLTALRRRLLKRRVWAIAARWRRRNRRRHAAWQAGCDFVRRRLRQRRNRPYNSAGRASPE